MGVSHNHIRLEAPCQRARRQVLKADFRCDGFTVTELLVAATLLISVMSVVAPLAVRSGRLWQDSRHYRIALDELSNQLEQLTSLEAKARKTALGSLAVSDHARQALPNPTLSAEMVSDADGSRLILRINWDRLGAAKPLALVAWVDPLPAATGKVSDLDSKEGQSP